MHIEYKIVVEFPCFHVNNFRNYTYLQKTENRNNSNIMWHDCTNLYRDDVELNILHYAKNGVWGIEIW